MLRTMAYNDVNTFLTGYFPLRLLPPNELNDHRVFSLAESFAYFCGQKKEGCTSVLETNEPVVQSV